MACAKRFSAAGAQSSSGARTGVTSTTGCLDGEGPASVGLSEPHYLGATVQFST
jgi:hypothetical protein